MQNSIDIGWLDVGTREDSTLAIQDHGRLQRVLSELCDQDNQHPSLCVFLGGKTKNYALQQLYPQNNIKRHESEAPIKLRYDVASLQSRRPVLLADGEIPSTDKFHTAKRLDAGVGHPVSWNNYSAAKILLVLWSRLIFVFTDVVCIFIDDAASMNPRMVFETLYRSVVISAYRISKTLWPDLCPAKETDLVELNFARLYKRFSDNAVSSANLRREELKCFSGQLSRMRSSRICLFCLLRSAQHVLACGHTVCDRCAQIFGSPASGLEYQFTIKGCLCCLYQRPLVVDVLPPTMSPTILAIDGGGVRGVIPLEFLLLVQEHLRPCAIQDVVDLALGTSSGGLIALGLFAMTWDVTDCSERFNTLARRIFRERRPSLLPLLLRQVFGFMSVFGDMAKWVQWLLHDSCYDSRVFDAALKSAFGEHRRIFGAARDDPPGPRRSGPKVGVVTTSISRDTSTFVIGNFNVSHDSRDENDFRIIRPDDTRNEPTVWRIARATAAAPFFFTPADLQGIGSFQDGGLKYNFAGEIAHQVSHQIWPTAMGSTKMLSLGTGKAQSSDQTPHFRHIFRDSFVRRGFDAWMSTMESDSDWRKWRGRLSDSVKSDSHRLDVSLGNTPHTIDAVETMEDYRNLVILQVGSARMARDAATALLISRLFFVVGSLPENTATAFWCRGSVRCKGPARKVILALENLYPDGLSYVSDCGLIDRFGGLDSLCPLCGCYNRSISFLTRHLDYTT
ncbi:hypothetical protein PENSOL_c011G11247 [Penicillium solitum]|uniref:PNPLA domain-containing protein n=1 Tax=Penicillium solitum TaxID=60172 RepID=A0A1V6R8X0_9EURO|nr:uncharacterized protein PENSOL_c011G11247 [Penicillium solitum]OQD97721.1 hypothetical protein PENSOL_c011G11247 [Penicillium solitum]